MPRPLFDSEYLFGIHEPGGERYMLEAGKPGWILFTEELGNDPNNQNGTNFTRWSNQNFGVITRLNNGYGTTGTIPNSQQYGDFAQRCANYVRASRGCKIWIIGNEMNYEVERPPASPTRSALPTPSAAPAPESASTTSRSTSSGSVQDAQPGIFSQLMRGLLGPLLRYLSKGMGDAQLYSPDAELPELGDPFRRGDPGRFSAINQPELTAPDSPTRAANAPATRSGKEVITPQKYAECYRLCRDAIHAVPGHGDDQVLIGSVAPWNAQTTYPGNPNGDWIQYFRDILNELGPNGCDGITIHTYTHAADPNLIHEEHRMNPPFQNYQFQFRAYRDFMNAIPVSMRHLPVYITETDEDVAWLNRDIGWIQRAYGEIDHWNQQPGNQQIRALILYRWPQIDKWYIEGKQGVVDDFRSALRHDYRWRVAAPSPLSLRTGNRIRMLDIVNLRRTAGYKNKPINDILAHVPEEAVLEILDGQYRETDGLIWWNVRMKNASGAVADGWLSQNSPTGTPLIEKTNKRVTSSGQFVGQDPGDDTDTDDSAPLISSDRLVVGGRAKTLDIVRLRRSPGFRDKPIGDVVTEVASGTTTEIEGGPRTADELTWWEVSGQDGQGSNVRGWMAESTPAGARLLEPVAGGDDESDAEIPTDGGSTGQFAMGEQVHTLDVVRLRHSPGFRNKPTNDVIAEIQDRTTGTILGGPLDVDGLVWWKVATTTGDGTSVTGWMAESIQDTMLLGKGASDDPSRGDEDKFRVGEQVRTLDIVRMRKTPGFFNKPAADIVMDVAKGAIGNISGGPQNADGLTWWRIKTDNERGQTVEGWMAESLANGILLLEAHTEGHKPDTGGAVPGARFTVGDNVKTVDFVRMRRTPGYFDKPSSDIIADIFAGSFGKILSGPQAEDELIWWRVEASNEDGTTVRGWMAQDAPGPNGFPLLEKVDASVVPAKPVTRSGKFKENELVVTATVLRVRSTPGHQNKPPDDVLGAFPEKTTLNIIDGPQSKDDLTWWRVGGITLDGPLGGNNPGGPDGERIGWVAESVEGNQLLLDAPRLPGTNIPDKEAHIYLGPPIDKVFTIGQVWGENPQFYRQFRAGGVALRGHNGIDFNTPTGSNIISVDVGTVLETNFDGSGFGHYVVVGHNWGHSIYAHLHNIAVQTGQQVGRGAFLGKSGNSGASTGPHLHFSIRIKGYNVADGWAGFSDPLPYLPREFIILPPYLQPVVSRSASPTPASASAPTGVDATLPFGSVRLAPSGITVDVP